MHALLKFIILKFCQFLIYNHTFCLLTSIYVLLNYASARPIMCFIALILFSLVLNFMYGNLNLTVLFKFIVYIFCLLIVHVYFYVEFKCSLEFCFNCLFLFDSKYILLHFIVLLHCKFVGLVNPFCPLQIKNVSSHALLCQRYRFCIFLPFFSIGF